MLEEEKDAKFYHTNFIPLIIQWFLFIRGVINEKTKYNKKQYRF